MRLVKKIYISVVISSIMFLGAGCEKEKSNVKVAKIYIQAFNLKDYDIMEYVLADTFEIEEMGSTQKYIKADYRKSLDWDEVFETKYQIEDISKTDSITTVLAQRTSKRISYLHEEPFKCKMIFHIQQNKIGRIEIDVINFNLETFNRNWVTFTKWLKDTDPDNYNNLTADHTKESAEFFVAKFEEFKLSNN
ncbi:MAG: hypothetical protein MI922_05615 [Bacteroidales bacterium]|nr:hypothetical protein [Bacteroidales bacterium]